jgi:hypothetical protein
MESLHAKAILARPETAMTSVTAASTAFTGSRVLSATATHQFGRRPKSSVLKGLSDKSMLPSVSATNLRPGTAINPIGALRPDGDSYYTKIDMIRPESCINFKKIRPGSAVTFNTKLSTTPAA